MRRELMIAVLRGAAEPDPPWFLRMTQMSHDAYIVDKGDGEISLLNRETLEQLLEQFLRRKT
jgi:hypothetical protein